MKQEIARRWIKALRSGKYKQGKGQLRRGNKFCCLGVLCNLHAQAHPEIAAMQLNKNSYMGLSALPPSPVRKWAGLKYAQGNRRSDLFAPALSLLNDEEGWSFMQIADYIEEHWEDL